MSVEHSGPIGTPPERLPVSKSIRRELTLKAVASAHDLSQSVTSQERDMLAIDPFLGALRPPRNWQKDIVFQNIYDKSVSKVIDDSDLAAFNNYELKQKLGLHVSAVDSDSEHAMSGDILKFLAAELSTYPGRLADANHRGQEGDIAGYRIWLMQRAVQLFAADRMPVDDIVEKKFAGNQEARLLLKGGIAEVLKTRAEHDKANRWK